MKSRAKSTKTQSQPKLTSSSFGKWLRTIPQNSDQRVTLQPPISLTQSEWAMLAVDASRQGISLDELLQGSINTFVGMVQDDLAKFTRFFNQHVGRCRLHRLLLSACQAWAGFPAFVPSVDSIQHIMPRCATEVRLLRRNGPPLFQA